ncbi:serine protease [Cellulomonas composti]|uniref:Serine protease n=2 Tax=Cellulomonas composti TaxID=266130 RepID=A0A511J6X9_9CELL|nr:serine protease [Cellulomonas composti]
MLRAGAVLGVLALAGCGGTVQAAQEKTGTGERARVAVADAGALDDVVAASWALGVETLQAVDDDAGAVVSPSSLVSALAMLAEGAVDGETAPFDAALGASGQERTDAVDALLAALARYDGDPALVAAEHPPTTPMVHTRQRVVVDDDARIAQPYLDRLWRAFGAGVLVTDLASSDGKAALDAWVALETGGLVDRSAIVPDESLVTVLQDVVAFAAAWQQPFAEAGTSNAPFAIGGGAGADVPTMHALLTVPAVQRDGWVAVRLPYADDLHADVYLPPDGSDLATDPAGADPQVLSALSAALDDAAPVVVRLALPKLALRTTTNLAGVLDELGVGSQARTGVLADGSPVTLAQATQQAVLLVDEEGTRAAAVTELGDAGSAAPLVDLEVDVDRPFLLAVQDGETGWPVFLAAVRDPRG